MIGLFGLKESLFGTFYMLNESTSAYAEATPWNIRLCIIGYVLDAIQVVHDKNLPIYSLCDIIGRF